MENLGKPRHRRGSGAFSVLIVDDSGPTLQAAAEVLRDSGYIVHTARGVRALERLGRALSEPPRLALVEFRLRGASGDRVAAMLHTRRSDGRRATPVITTLSAWPRCWSASSCDGSAPPSHAMTQFQYTGLGGRQQVHAEACRRRIRAR